MSTHSTSILLRKMLNTAITAVKNYNSSLNLHNMDNAFMELAKFMTIQSLLDSINVSIKLAPATHASVGVDPIPAISITCPYSDELPIATFEQCVAETVGFEEYDAPETTGAYFGIYRLS